MSSRQVSPTQDEHHSFFVRPVLRGQLGRVLAGLTAFEVGNVAAPCSSCAPFDFPGGRRFHFREPGGCELAVWRPTDSLRDQ